MSQYRISKEDVGATLYLCDGSTLSGSLFRSPFSAKHSGPQTVEELLAEAGAGLPFATREGRFLLIGTACVAAVLLAGLDEVAQGFWTRVPVALRLMGGHSFQGSLLLEEGAGQRLSDAARSSNPWLTLEASNTLLWISKAHVLTLEPGGV